MKLPEHQKKILRVRFYFCYFLDNFERFEYFLFSGVRESTGNGNYIYVHYKGQKLRVHYVDAGNPDGKVLLCLHGEPFWSQSWRKLIPYLVKNNYRVIAPDFVGFGRSDKLVDWRAYSLSLHEETIVQLMRQLGCTFSVIKHYLVL